MLHDEIGGVTDYGMAEPKCLISFYDNHKSENGDLNFEPLEPLERCSLNLNPFSVKLVCLILIHYNLT